MELRYDAFSLLVAASSSIGVVVSILLITLPGRNRRANLWFALFILTNMASVFINGFSTYTGLYRYIPHTIGITFPLLLLLAPFLYLYFRCLLDSQYRVTRRALIHFAPILLFFIAAHRFYLGSPSYKIEFLRRWIDGTPRGTDLLYGLAFPVPFLIQAPLYLSRILALLRRYRASVKNERSGLVRRRVFWGFAALAASVVVVVLLALIYALVAAGVWSSDEPNRIVPLLISAYVFALSVTALRQMDLFKANDGIESSSSSGPVGRSSPCPDNRLETEERRRLDEYMASAKPYLDPELSLSDLAGELGMTRGHLSWLINNSIGKSFYDYVNTYRVEEALIMLAEGGRKSILECAFSAGFNTKSTFYKFFKIKTGMSPGEYAKSAPIDGTHSR